MERILNVLKFWPSFKPGSLKICRAKDVFSHVDLAFRDIELSATQNTDNIAFYGLVLPATFKEALSSLSPDFNSLILSEETVVEICLRYKEFLTDEKQKAFFYLGGDVIAKINFYKDGLHINRYNLSSKNVWDTKHERIFIVPALSV